VRKRSPAARGIVVAVAGLLVAALAYTASWEISSLQRPSQVKFTLLSWGDGNARRQQVAARIAGLRLVNYYPAASAWTRMWTNWQPAVLNRDFARIRALGGNAVRIVVFPSVFGWPKPSPRMAARFATTLTIAASQGLGVQVTLFDLWDAYREVAQSQAWLRSLMRPYADDPYIRLVELQNEVNPANGAAIAWVRALLPTLRSVLPRTPSTVSVSGAAGPGGFIRLRRELGRAPLDVADLHFYGDAVSAYGWMIAARRAAGSLPLFVGEIGSPVIADGIGVAAAELQQAHWYSVVFAAARAAGVSVPAPWTLYDFTPGGVPAWARSSLEEHFGLYTAAGRRRSSAGVVEQAFHGHIVDNSNLTFNLAGSNDQPMVWSRYLPAQGTLTYDARVGHLKRGSVRLADTRLSAQGVPGYYLVPTNAPKSHSLWTVSAWAKGIDVNGTAQIALAWFRSDGAYLGSSNSTPLPYGYTGWMKLTVRGRVPSGATAVRVFLKSGGVAGSVWFDDVRISVGARRRR
jgi:hypothetical protein